MTDTATMFAVVAATLYAAHAVADHWVQSHTAACRKAAPGLAGAAWCAWHVTTYLVTCTAAVVAVAAVQRSSMTLAGRARRWGGRGRSLPLRRRSATAATVAGAHHRARRMGDVIRRRLDQSCTRAGCW